MINFVDLVLLKSICFDTFKVCILNLVLTYNCLFLNGILTSSLTLDLFAIKHLLLRIINIQS